MSDPEILVLASLVDGEKHGYAIMEDIQGFANVRLGPDTLYRAITRLEQRGWIRSADSEAPLRRKPIRQILFDLIDDDGGPLIYGVTSEQQQRSFDATCRKFLRFLGQPSR